MPITLRTALPEDASLLRYWDQQAHVRASDPDSDWQWETELLRQPKWRQQLVAELNKRPIGFLQIIDPVLEDGGYWWDYLNRYEPDNNRPNRLRAIDIWIGEADCLNRGYGTEMMLLALKRSFEPPSVQAILIDPLSNNSRAHHFYQRLGFQPQHRHTFPDDDDPCLVFKLERQMVSKTKR